MARYELWKHKKADSIKWIITSVVLVLLIVAIVGLCLQLFGKGKVKPSEWFTKSEAEETETLPDTNGGESGSSDEANANYVLFVG